MRPRSSRRPGVAGAGSEPPQPLAGAEAGPIQALVARFLPEYVAAAETSELSYLSAPGAAIQPLDGAIELLSISGVTQLGSGEGPRRAILAAVKVRDPQTGATYPLVYRLGVTKDTRWYVERVEGELHERRLRLALFVAAAAVALLLAPAAALAAGNDVGRNIGSLLRGYAAQIYGGIVAAVGLIFLINRRFTDLAMYFLAATLVGWLVFSPDQVADAARAIGRQVLP